MFRSNLYRLCRAINKAKTVVWQESTRTAGVQNELPVEQNVFDTAFGQAKGNYIERGNFNE